MLFTTKGRTIMANEKIRQNIITRLLLWDILIDVLDFLIFGSIIFLLLEPKELVRLMLILWQFRFLIQLLLGAGMLLALVQVIRRIRTIIIIRREITKTNRPKTDKADANIKDGVITPLHRAAGWNLDEYPYPLDEIAEWALHCITGDKNPLVDYREIECLFEKQAVSGYTRDKAERNLKLAESLIAQGADINVVGGENGDTPLHIAVRNHDLAMVELLVNNGASLDIKNRVDGPLAMIGDEIGQTPVELAESLSYKLRKCASAAILSDYNLPFPFDHAEQIVTFLRRRKESLQS